MNPLVEKYYVMIRNCFSHYSFWNLSPFLHIRERFFSFQDYQQALRKVTVLLPSGLIEQNVFAQKCSFIFTLVFTPKSSWSPRKHSNIKESPINSNFLFFRIFLNSSTAMVWFRQSSWNSKWRFCLFLQHFFLLIKSHIWLWCFPCIHFPCIKKNVHQYYLYCCLYYWNSEFLNCHNCS